MPKYIDAKTAEKCLISRAYESAIYNIGVEFKDAALVYKDLAENRIPTWIDNIPTADVEEVRHGEWIIHEDDWFGDYGECSKCGQSYVPLEGERLDWNYCPNCGAKMDGGRE